MPRFDVALEIPQTATFLVLYCPRCDGASQLDELTTLVWRVNTDPRSQHNLHSAPLPLIPRPAQKAAHAAVDALGPTVSTLLASLVEAARAKISEKLVIDAIAVGSVQPRNSCRPLKALCIGPRACRGSRRGGRRQGGGPVMRVPTERNGP
jgi:hypothetical protein